MLECVINISEGARADTVSSIAAAGGRLVLDVHSDPHHNRTVITMAGGEVEDAALAIARAAVDAIDIRIHAGVHPRLGAVDVVPFVPLPDSGSTMPDAMAARDRFAGRFAADTGVPCFLYGPERTLPDIRRRAFAPLVPDYGDDEAHPSAGVTCVGARDVLVAYNLWLADSDLAAATAIAASIRQPAIRALAMRADSIQVSCNLVDPFAVGPAAVYDLVATQAAITRAELVGLLPRRVLHAIPRARWAQLDVSEAKTIEARLGEAGLDGEVAGEA